MPQYHRPFVNLSVTNYYFARDGAWVVFFASTVALVRQHYKEVNEYFRDNYYRTINKQIRINYLVGPEKEEKPTAETMLKHYQVTFVLIRGNESTIRDTTILSLVTEWSPF